MERALHTITIQFGTLLATCRADRHGAHLDKQEARSGAIQIELPLWIFFPPKVDLTTWHAFWPKESTSDLFSLQGANMHRGQGPGKISKSLQLDKGVTLSKARIAPLTIEPYTLSDENNDTPLFKPILLALTSTEPVYSVRITEWTRANIGLRCAPTSPGSKARPPHPPLLPQSVLQRSRCRGLGLVTPKTGTSTSDLAERATSDCLEWTWTLWTICGVLKPSLAITDVGH